MKSTPSVLYLFETCYVILRMAGGRWEKTVVWLPEGGSQWAIVEVN